MGAIGRTHWATAERNGRTMDKGVSRREFLITAGAGALVTTQAFGRARSRAEEEGFPKPRRLRIHVVYEGADVGGWPGPKFPAADEIARFQRHLEDIEDDLSDVRFVGGQHVKSAQEAANLAPEVSRADGLLVFTLNFGDGSRVRPLVDTGVPTAIILYPFSGHHWMYYSQWQAAGDKVLALPTSDPGEIGRAVRLLRVPGLMRRSRVIAVGAPRGTESACAADQVKERFGTEVLPIDNQRVIEAHGAVDPEAAEAEAESYWLSKAKEIREPKREDIVSSARLYLAIKDMMIQGDAQAVTSSHCMGAPAKCCLAFSKLNDLGFVGACEGDMDSTLTMMIFGYAFGLPGFITDPLFDLARNAVIHAHCTSTTRLDGPEGGRAPFRIRTQCETEQGVALEVEMREGQKITCAKLAGLDTMLISTGEITDIPDYDDRGCRTQILTEVRDARAMFHNWGGGVLPQDMMTLLHRVIFYGDRMQDMRDLAPLMGLKLVEEC